MPFYLHIEVDSSLAPEAFRERVVVPLGRALEGGGLGRVLEGGPADAGPPGGRYELALEVTDQDLARRVVEQVLRVVDDRE